MVGDIVMARGYSRDQWVEAEVMEKLSRVTYQVKPISGLLWKRHVDQLHTTLSQCEQDAIPEDRGDSTEKDLVL